MPLSQSFRKASPAFFFLQNIEYLLIKMWFKARMVVKPKRLLLALPQAGWRVVKQQWQPGLDQLRIVVPQICETLEITRCAPTQHKEHCSAIIEK